MLPDPLAQEAIVALAADLVRIPSVNPAIAPEEGHGEQAVASLAVEWLSVRGVRAWLEEAAPGRPNAVAEPGGCDQRRRRAGGSRPFAGAPAHGPSRPA